MPFKVAVCGAAGGIGQPLSLLLKLNELVGELSLYDVVPFTPGVACDISHIYTPAKTTGYFKSEAGDQLLDALKDADVVVIPHQSSTQFVWWPGTLATLECRGNQE